MLKHHPKQHGTWFAYLKKEGGLGVLQLEIHNEALLMKNVHKFFNKAEVPWVQLVREKHYSNGKLPTHILKGSFWCHDKLRLLQKFKGLASVLVHKGDTCFLCHDLWGGSTRSQGLPQLFSFARKHQITVAKARGSKELAHLFTLPLSEEAFQQLLVHMYMQHSQRKYTPRMVLSSSPGRLHGPRL
jgi:hypothetical protein